MRAVILKDFGRPLEIEDIADPVIGTGEVVVDVVAAPVLSYTDEVFSGARRYLLPTPVVPGCGAIGRVREAGPDATKLKPGDWVFCDPTLRSRDNALTPDIVLQGWGAPEVRAGKGSSATTATAPSRAAFGCRPRMPCRSVTSIPPRPVGGPRDQHAADRLRRPARHGPQGRRDPAGKRGYGQLRQRRDAVTALAMGARCVVAPGRNVDVLADLAGRFGNRVAPVLLTGDAALDDAAMQAAAPGAVDAVLDLLPPLFASPPPSRRRWRAPRSWLCDLTAGWC